MGLDFAIVLSETEAIASSIADIAEIEVPLTEPPPLRPMLILAPRAPAGRTSVAAWAMPLPPSPGAEEFQAMQWLPVPWD